MYAWLLGAWLICVYCVTIAIMFGSGNRRSAASNFEFLNETLCEAKLREIAVEERKIKLEEDKLKFERKNW